MQEISLLEAPLGITTIEGIDTSIVSKYCYKSGNFVLYNSTILFNANGCSIYNCSLYV
jgi:hypothetical protein